MNCSSDEEEVLTPKELREQVKNAAECFLPDRSKDRYLKEYDNFNSWRLAKKVKSHSETVFLSYFLDLAKTKAAPSLWSIYSMLKAVMKMKHDINISLYPKLLAYLKRMSVGYKPKKSNVFSASEVETFLNEAPDIQFLATKFILIIGISGACRTCELLKLTVNNIEKHSESLMLVKLLDTKTKIDRTFVLREEYVKIVEKYMALRPKTVKTDRFFLQYRNSKCVCMPIGINKMCKIPQEIATYLKLKEPNSYTGHSFRRTSATLLASAGADLTTIKRHGGWKSNNVAEIYIQDNIENKSKISKNIVNSINLKKSSPVNYSDPMAAGPSTSDHSSALSLSPTFTSHCSPLQEIPNTQITENRTTISVPNKTVTFNLTNCNNFTFNF